MPRLPRRLLVPVLVAAGLAAFPAAAAAGLRTWSQQPAMISNVGVHRSGEFVYQDYVYDDHGPNTDGIDHTDAPFGASANPEDPTNPRLGSSGGQVRYAGDFFYAAADNRYDNVADLVEFRAAGGAGAVFYRFQLGALTRPDSTVIGMCVDQDRRRDTGLTQWPLGAGVVQALGCDHFVTVYGTGANITTADGTTTDLVARGGAVAVDVAANTIEVKVPRAIADPAGAVWRYTVGSGLWNPVAGTWLQVPPGPQAIGAPTPTGGGVGEPQVWDLLSNNDEPNTYWREERQANDLHAMRLDSHWLDVDFGKLASRVREADPKLTGVVDRLYVSRFAGAPDEGITISNPVTRNFVYHGRIQPYAMVIPSDYWTRLAANPKLRLPFDQCLHPLNGNHHVEIYYAEAQARAGYNPLVTGTVPATGYLGFSVYTDLYDRLGKLYACGNGRGEGVGYTGGDGMVDAIELWDDVEAHYRVDPDRRTLHGISLGAIGTWYMSRLYPDRFSAAMPYIFSPGFGSANPALLNLYNLPVFFVIGTGDEFGQFAFGDQTADQLEALGNEYVYDHQLTREHELSLGDEALPFTVPLMYSRTRVENPARVRFLFDPAQYSPKLPGRGGAYWVSGMRPAAAGGGTIDVTSLARAGELPRDQVVFSGLYANTRTGNQARFRGLLRMTPEQFAAAWRPAEFEAGWEQLDLQVTHTSLPVPAKANGFLLTASALDGAALDTGRMRLTPKRTIAGTVSGDRPLELTLLGRFPTTVRATLDGQPVALSRSADRVVLSLPLSGARQQLRVLVS